MKAAELVAPTWMGRDDGLGPERVHQRVKTLDLSDIKVAQKNSFCLLGFACDEGVRRNKGRVGASEAPGAIRKSLASLAWNSKSDLYDLGDVTCKDGDLEAAQRDLGNCVKTLLAKNYTPLVLGGGHETAWGHFQGFTKEQKESLLIINFDAHYDMRPMNEKKEGSSGTPFLQIAESCKKEKLPFNYLCIGIQGLSNTASLFKTAEQHDVKTIFADTLHNDGIISSLDVLSQELAKYDHIYLSVCMDVFAQAYAPGVSAPQALGLTPWQVLPLLRKIIRSKNILSADFVELCPAFDRDAQTARLLSALLMECCT